jgi:hypothetical protein
MTAELVNSELFDCEVVDGKGIVVNEHPLNNIMHMEQRIVLE